MQIFTHLAAIQEKSPMSVPLFIQPATYQSGLVCLFPWSLLALSMWWPISNYTWEPTPRIHDSSVFLTCVFQYKTFAIVICKACIVERHKLLALWVLWCHSQVPSSALTHCPPNAGNTWGCRLTAESSLEISQGNCLAQSNTPN